MADSSPSAAGARPVSGGDRYDVAVAGGGAVGAVFACALADSGMKVLLADPPAAEAPNPPSAVVTHESSPPAPDESPAFAPRPIALSLASERVLAALGVWEALAGQATPIESIHVSEAGRFGATRLEAAECGLPRFGSVVAAGALGAALRDAVARRSAIHRAGGRIVDARVCAGAVLSRVSMEVGAGGAAASVGEIRDTGGAGKTGKAGGGGAAGGAGEVGGAGAAGEAGEVEAAGEAGGTGAAGEAGGVGDSGEAGGAGAVRDAGGAGAAGEAGGAGAAGEAGGAGAAGEVGGVGAAGEVGGAGAAGETGDAGGTGSARGAGSAGETGLAAETGSTVAAVAAEGTEEAGRTGGIEEAGHPSFAFTASLLVVADGGRSELRDVLGIGATIRDYPQRAIASVVEARAPREHTAFERFTPGGPVALLPMGGARYGLVWCCGGERADRLAVLPERAFVEALDAVFAGRLGGFASAGGRTVFGLRFARANATVAERVALIGNAASHLHPVAGQGFNLGMRDAACLAEVVAAGRREGYAPGDAQVLERYRRWRAPDHARVTRFTDALVGIFCNRFSPVAPLRAPALVALDLAPPLKRALARRAAGLAGKAPRLALGVGP